MRRAEIRSEFDAIVAFAGVERFLDTPVKRYSSGMYVRLAFAVAAHLRSEILLIDEVLAVGDIEFQRRCLGKMRDVARSGRTVLFVSHHLQSVSTLCHRLLVLEGGQLVHDGEVHAGLTRYLSGFERGNKSSVQESKRPGSGELRVSRAASVREFYECAEPKAVRFLIEQRSQFDGRFYVSVHLVDPMGTVVAQCDSRLLGEWFDAGQNLELEFSFNTPWLKPGTYRVDVYLCAAGFIDQCEHACSVEVLPLLPYPATAGSEAMDAGLVLADFNFCRVPRASEEPSYAPDRDALGGANPSAL
jgi:lipopolysaccharide transport system ATP-binding protein